MLLLHRGAAGAGRKRPHAARLLRRFADAEGPGHQGGADRDPVLHLLQAGRPLACGSRGGPRPQRRIERARREARARRNGGILDGGASPMTGLSRTMGTRMPVRPWLLVVLGILLLAPLAAGAPPRPDERPVWKEWVST